MSSASSVVAAPRALNPVSVATSQHKSRAVCSSSTTSTETVDGRSNVRATSGFEDTLRALQFWEIRGLELADSLIQIRLQGQSHFRNVVRSFERVMTSSLSSAIRAGFKFFSLVVFCRALLLYQTKR